jgi:hypothetical protein
VVGEGGHYLNRPGELRGGVLELIRTHRDGLEVMRPEHAFGLEGAPVPPGAGDC